MLKGMLKPVVAALVATGLATPAYADGTPITDHVKCYSARDSAEKAEYSLDLLPRFNDYPQDTGCTIKVPAKLVCTSVAKTNVAPVPPNPLYTGESLAQAFLCYKLKCPKAEIERQIIDQFGSEGDDRGNAVMRVAALSSSKLLCVPGITLD
jgi:hypothetical protein